MCTEHAYAHARERAQEGAEYTGRCKNTSATQAGSLSPQNSRSTEQLQANFSTEEERLDRVLMMTHGVMVK
jgi:hypothetical protein